MTSHGKNEPDPIQALAMFGAAVWSGVPIDGAKAILSPSERLIVQDYLADDHAQQGTGPMSTDDVLARLTGGSRFHGDTL